MRRGWSLRDREGIRHQPLRENDRDASWTPVACGDGILLPWPQTRESVTCPGCLEASLRGTPHNVYTVMPFGELREAVVEGSGRALAEWERRGETAPTADRGLVWLP
jgi:hypothetical protein